MLYFLSEKIISEGCVNTPIPVHHDQLGQMYYLGHVGDKHYTPCYLGIYLIFFYNYDLT